MKYTTLDFDELRKKANGFPDLIFTITLCEQIWKKQDEIIDWINAHNIEADEKTI